MNPPRVAICIPHHGDVKALWAGSLANMLVHVGKLGVPFNGGRVMPDLGPICMASSSSIADNRERAALDALAKGPDFLLWLDTDHTFDGDLLARLMAHMGKVEVVGCNYPRRSASGAPTGPTAVNVVNGEAVPVYTTADKANRKIVEQVDRMGLGACLMSAAVFKGLERPWFAADQDAGEDGYFFRKLRAASGIRPFVDHNLSWEIGHIAERVVTNADAEADQARWSLKDARQLG